MSDTPKRRWYQFSLKWLLFAIGYVALAFGVWRNDIETTLGAMLFVPLLISTLVIFLALLRLAILWAGSQSYRDEIEGDVPFPNPSAPAPNPPKNQSGPDNRP